MRNVLFINYNAHLNANIRNLKLFYIKTTPSSSGKDLISFLEPLSLFDTVIIHIINKYYLRYNTCVFVVSS